MIEKKDIEARLKELQASRDQTAANLVAHDGAIEDCKFWLSKFDKLELVVSEGEDK